MTDGRALDGVRVLEWGSGVSAPYAARLLADLGAQVIKVEAPSGDFVRDRPGLFHMLNAGKAGARLDSLAELLRGADIFLSNQPLRVRAAAAVDPRSLAVVHPGIVAVSITPLGDSSSRADQQLSPLHALAASGMGSLVGHQDRDPLPIPFEFTEYYAGAHAAAAALSGLVSGRGGRFEISVAEVLFQAAYTWSRLYVDVGEPFSRAGRRTPGSGGTYPLSIFPCADGYVTTIGRSQQDWEAFRRVLGDPAWAHEPPFDDARRIAREAADDADARLLPILSGMSRSELFERARLERFPLAPVSLVDEVVAEPHFEDRGSWSVPLDAPGGPRFLQTPFKLSGSDEPQKAMTGPALGEVSTWTVRSTAASGIVRNDAPLAGLRVLDLGWVWAGPMVSSMLADLGADVIKIEHADRLDNARLRGRPVRNGVPLEGPETELSWYFHQNNHGKRSLTLNMKDPAGAALLRKLAATSDLVVENLTPGVFDKLGVGYEDMVGENPGLVWLSMASAGNTGPLSGMRAYAPIMTGLAGLEGLVGYDDQDVVGMLSTALGDPNSAAHGLVAALAALTQRRRTGRGQFIDLSQIECCVALLCEPIAEFAATGMNPAIRGSDNPAFAPHGYYRCTEGWVAIAVGSDIEWRALAGLIGVAGDAQFATHEDRRVNATALDQRILGFTGQAPRDEVVRRLTDAGVGATPVLSVEEAAGDPDVGRILVEVVHRHSGREALAHAPWHLDDEIRIRRGAPTIGEHNAEILAGILDLSADEIADLVARGVVR